MPKFQVIVTREARSVVNRVLVATLDGFNLTDATNEHNNIWSV